MVTPRLMRLSRWLPLVCQVWAQEGQSSGKQEVIEDVVVDQNSLVRTTVGMGISGNIEGFAYPTLPYALLNHPVDLSFQDDNTLFVADLHNQCIRKFDLLTAQLTRFAGACDGSTGFENGASKGASFFNARGIDVTADGEIYIADTGNHAVRRIKGGEVETLGGGNGPGFRNSAVRYEVTCPAGRCWDNLTINTPFVTKGTDGLNYGAYQNVTVYEDNKPMLWNPWDVAVDGDNIYVSDTDNHRIRRIFFNKNGWRITTYAGTGEKGSDDGHRTQQAKFKFPQGLTFCGGSLYVADTGNHVIRKISGNKVETFAGSGKPGFANSKIKKEKPKASEVIVTKLPPEFALPRQVTCDKITNELFVADTTNQRIRKIRTDGITLTLAGSPARGYLDGYEGANAIGTLFNDPIGLAVRTFDGWVYVADSRNHVLRSIEDLGSTLSNAPSVPTSLVLCSLMMSFVALCSHSWLTMG